MPGSLLPWVFPQFFDTDGVPLAGGKLASFLAGTNTPTPVYTDADLLVPHTNPIILNAAGRPGAVYLDTLSYKFTLRDQNDVLIDTMDPVVASGVGIGVHVEGTLFTFGGEQTANITVAAYPAGTDLEDNHWGTAVFPLDSAILTTGSEYAVEGILQAQSTISIQIAVVNLTDGLPATPIAGGELSATSATGILLRGTALTFAAPGAVKHYAIKAKIAAALENGRAWGIRLVRIA